jgi:hypothetical protein
MNTVIYQQLILRGVVPLRFVMSKYSRAKPGGFRLRDYFFSGTAVVDPQAAAFLAPGTLTHAGKRRESRSVLTPPRHSTPWVLHILPYIERYNALLEGLL